MQQVYVHVVHLHIHLKHCHSLLHIGIQDDENHWFLITNDMYLLYCRLWASMHLRLKALGGIPLGLGDWLVEGKTI